MGGPSGPLVMADPCPLSLAPPGFLLGYVSSRRGSCTVCGDFLPMVSEDGPYRPAEDPRGPPPLYWSDLREMFQKYLNEEKIEGTIR